MADIWRKHGVSDSTFYNWSNRYGGMEVSDARRLKALGNEIDRLNDQASDDVLSRLMRPHDKFAWAFDAMLAWR